MSENASSHGRACHVGPLPPCDPAELRPLLDFLARREPTEQRREFLRGTLLPDGRLDLCKQQIGPGGAAALAAVVRGHPQVRHLLLGANGLGDDGAAAVAEVVRGGTLATVYLGCNFITAVGVQQLADALLAQPGVTALWLKRNPIGDRGVRVISEVLSRCPFLRTLDLNQTGLTATGLSDLVGTRVERLYLGGNRLGPAEACILAQMLRESRTLRHLYLSVNRLGDEGVSILTSEGLKYNQTLQTLSLASNGIGPDGATVLANAVQTHPSLRVLDLGREPSTQVLGEQENHIGDRGAAALAEALPGHPSLAVLRLMHNDIGDAGAAILAEGLAGNRSLVELRLGKRISRHWRQLIEEMLVRNRAAGATDVELDPDVAMIQSVYRTSAAQPQLAQQPEQPGELASP